MAHTPKYRRRKVRNKFVAYVSLTDSETKQRKDFWLGEYDSPESHEKYHMILAQWQAAGKRLPDWCQSKSRGGQGITVAQLCAAYLENEFLNDYCHQSARLTIALVKSMYGSMLARDFGPNALRQVREAMIRKKLAKSVVVQRTSLAIRIFKWAVAHELLDESAWRRLQALEPIDHRRTDVKPNRKILPAPIEHVRMVQQVVSRQVSAMIELQLITGARVREILSLRPCDIDRTGKVWIARLDLHKTAHHGKKRILYFGPRAQDILRPFLLRSPSKYLFSPAEADDERRRKLTEERKTPLSCGNKTGSNRLHDPEKKPGDHYTDDSYRRCIQRACKICDVPLWSPRQLRHNAATEIEKQYDSVVAAIMLGHSSAKITEAVYIQRENTKAVEVSAAIG